CSSSRQFVTPRALHPFPTRRSSDLLAKASHRHVQRTRNRRRRERQLIDFRAQFLQSLLVFDAEAMLLVDDQEPQTVELDAALKQDRKSTRLNSSHVKISYAVFCLKK